MKPVISIVVPTHKRPQLLQRCLSTLVTQDLYAGAYEIVVVDDARSRSQRAAIRDFAHQHHEGPRIRCICPPDGARGPAAARNAGWRAARGEIIAFTDDDTIPAANWLSEGLRAMKPGVIAAWGDVIVPMPELPTDAERNTGGLDGAEFVTANVFVRREALQQAGGFDERFKRPWREDSDLYFTLLEQQHKVVAAPAAIVIHPARRAPFFTSLRQHRNLFFEALLFKKHRKLYREKISAAPPLHYYLTVAMILLALAALTVGHAGFAATGTAGWLLMTAVLAVQRLHGSSRDWRNVLDIVLSSAVIPPLAVFWRLAGALRFRVLFA